MSPNSSAQFRKSPRVLIRPVHQLEFFLTEDRAAPGLSVVNISVSGVALERESLTLWPEPGTKIQGWLRIMDRLFQVTVTLIHISGQIVGCSFEQPEFALLEAIESHLQPELEAITMERKEPRTEGLARGEEAHWFHGREGSEFYYVLARGVVQRFHLAFFGNYLEGGHKRPIRFGVIIDDKSLDEDVNQAVRWFDSINAEQLSLTIRLIQAIPGLPEAHLSAILKMIY